MFKEFRPRSITAEDWAKNLGLEVDSILGEGALRRFAAHANSDRRWNEIRHRLAPGSRILDAGCGMGQWVWYLGLNGMDSIGLDYSVEMIDMLKMRIPERSWIQGSVQDIPMPDGSVDAITSWGVVEHDESGPQAALKEFFRVLKHRGHVFVTTPLDSPQRRRASAKHFRASHQEGVFFQFFFTEQELCNFLECAGFKIELIVPTSRAYATLFPGLYRIAQRSRIANALVHRLTAPLVALLPASAGMVLVVGRKP